MFDQEREELDYEFNTKYDYTREAYGDQTDYGDCDDDTGCEPGLECLGFGFEILANVLTETKGPELWKTGDQTDNIPF